MKPMTHLLQNLNFNEDDINLILTDDATVVLMQPLNSLSPKHREFCLRREEYQNNALRLIIIDYKI